METKNKVILYDKEVRNKLQILDILIENNYTVTINHLKHITSFSDITLRKYIDLLKLDIEASQPSGMTLYYDSKVVTFEIEDAKQYILFRNSLVQTCTSVKLGIQLILGFEINVTNFCIEHNVNLATFRRRLKALRMEFSIYNLKVISRNGVLHLAGDESTIRKLAYYSLTEVYLGRFWPFKQYIDYDLLKNDVYNFSKITIDDDIFFREIIFDLAIQLIRIRNNRLIELAPAVLTEGKQLFPHFFENNNSSRLFSTNYEHEVSFFLFNLLSYDSFYYTKDASFTFEIIHTHSIYLSPLIKSASIDFLALISKKQVDNLTRLKGYLYSIYCEQMIYPTWSDKYIEKKLNINTPILEKKIACLLENEPDTPQKEIFFNISLLKKRYKFLFGEYRPFPYFEKEIRIKIINLKSELEKSMFETLIAYSFHYYYKFVFTGQDADITINTNSDLIFSTKKTETKQTRFICYVSSELNGRDIKLLHDTFEKFIKISTL